MANRRKYVVTKIVLSLIFGSGLGAGWAQQQGNVPVPENLVVDGIPAIPAAVAETAGRYSEFRTASVVDWHPQRRELLISTRFGNTAQLHTVAMPGGARRQLTFFPEPVRRGSYHPAAGDYLVFPKDIGGGEWFQLFRYDFATRLSTLLTDGKSRNELGPWSSKGDRIAYTSSRRNGKDADVWVMNPADSKTDRLLMQVQSGGWAPLDWSPDDSKLLVIEYVSINESYLWLVDTASGARTALTPRKQGLKVSYSGAQFSKDGKGIYLTSDADGEFQRLGYMDLATREIRSLTGHISWDVEEFALSHDGTKLAFTVNEDGRSTLHLLDTRSGRELPTPALPPGNVGELVWHRNSADLGFVMIAARSATDAYSLNTATGKVERWTESEGALDTGAFPEPELIRWKSFDGRTISGFLYQPPPKFAGKRPVIVNIHGGPESQFRAGFIGQNNYLLNELGVAIIYPNVRGSSGYGKSFLKLDNGFHREDTYKDIDSLFDWIAARPDLDGSRIAVTGGSYGGHMTLAISTFYSNRIRCSIDVVGMSNLVTFLEHTEAYRRDLRRAEYGDERDPKMREFLEKIAPMNQLAKIRKPMFVIAGKNDPRVPVSESDQIVAALKKQGTPVWYLMARNEGHGFSKKANADYQFYATVAFLEAYLLK